MKHTKLTLLPGLALAMTGAAFAQGDDCSNATVISSTGTWAFDTTVLLDSTFNGGGLCAGGASTINQDGFYQWTVPANGDYDFDTFGSSFDTKLSVHAGIGCAATCVGYNDDTGGLQSFVQLAGLTAGDQYLIQVGGYGTSAGAGVLNITQYIDPCLGATDDAFEDNDDCSNKTTLGAGAYTGLFVSMTDDDFYSVTIPAGMILTWDETYDSNDATYDVLDATCSTQYLTDENMGFTYANVTGAPETITVRAYNYPFATLNCTDYDIDLSIAPDPCQGADDSFEENDDCSTAAAIGNGTFTGLFVSKADKDHFSFCVADGDTVNIDVLHLVAGGDIDAFLWDASDANCGSGFGSGTYLDYGYTGSDNENLSWTNTTGGDVNCVLEVNVWTGSSSDCNVYDLILSGAGNCGGGNFFTYCDPADVNSTGSPAVLAGSFGTGIGSDLHLEATSGPALEFGYILVGTGYSDPGITLPQGGRLCFDLNGSFGRYNIGGGPLNSIGRFDSAGVLQNLVGTSVAGSGFDVPSTLPLTGAPAILSGETWYFQLWYRDTPAGAGSANLSNGLGVTFP
ncbi:MAG: hypothetical protein R3F33_13155 [Planctomycetota bacterium]